MTASVQHQDYLAYANRALEEYSFPDDAQVRMISLSENATFLVENSQPLAILRIYRSAYQSQAAIESELAWIDAIRSDGQVATPGVLRNRNDLTLTKVTVEGDQRFCSVFEYVAGAELAEHAAETYRVVGRTAATLHNQVATWTPLAGFERKTWDLETILGPNPHWGNWRLGPGVDSAGLELLERAERKLVARLDQYPVTADQGGLVHCDLRAANLMVDNAGVIWTIDFDDSGFSWFLWDLCSTTTFIEQRPDLAEIIDGWLGGYREVRTLREKDVKVIPDLVFLRRLHILAWLGSHPESDLAADLGDAYTHETYVLAERYLAGEFLSSLAGS